MVRMYDFESADMRRLSLGILYRELPAGVSPRNYYSFAVFRCF